MSVSLRLNKAKMEMELTYREPPYPVCRAKVELLYTGDGIIRLTKPVELDLGCSFYPHKDLMKKLNSILYAEVKKRIERYMSD